MKLGSNPLAPTISLNFFLLYNQAFRGYREKAHCLSYSGSYSDFPRAQNSYSDFLSSAPSLNGCILVRLRGDHESSFYAFRRFERSRGPLEGLVVRHNLGRSPSTERRGLSGHYRYFLYAAGTYRAIARPKCLLRPALAGSIS
jgi:hypothetical protein